jgi:hypothetical protein
VSYLFETDSAGWTGCGRIKERERESRAEKGVWLKQLNTCKCHLQVGGDHLLSRVWLGMICTSVILGTQEAEVGGSPSQTGPGKVDSFQIAAGHYLKMN